MSPVTKDQAQMLTTLAIACRPHRAPTWDEGGVMAAIAKVHDRALVEVALAVIRAASDKDAATPGVIPSNGSHWQEQLKPGRFQPDTWEPDQICTTCSKPQPVCASRTRYGDDDHAFVSRAHARQRSDRPAEAVARIVEDLHERVTTDPPPRPEPEAGTEGTSRVAPIRAALSKEDADA